MLSIFECCSYHDPDAFSRKKIQFATDLTLGSEARLESAKLLMHIAERFFFQ